jgi:Putative restriction endonuclease
MIAGLRLSAEAFLGNIPATKAELLDGRIVRHGEASLGENMVRGDLFCTLRDRFAAAKLPHHVYAFGAMVKINAITVRAPDCIVQHAGFGRAWVVVEPFIVADVITDAMSKGDIRARVSDYFSVASIQHYLLVDRHRRIVFQHCRNGAQIITCIVRDGDINLDAISISFSSLLGEVQS